MLFDAKAGRELRRFAGHSARIWHIAVNRTGHRVATAAFATVEGHRVCEVRVWDSDTGNVLHSASNTDRTRTLALSPDGTWLAVAPSAGEFLLSPIGTSNHAPVTLPMQASAVAYSTDGRQLAAADQNGAIRIWPTDGTPIHESTMRGIPGLHALVFHPDGTRLAGANRERTVVWDVASGEEILPLQGAGPRPSDNGFNPTLAWSPDGLRLAAGAWNRTVRVWDATDPTSPSGRTISAQRAANRAFAWHRERAETLDTPESDGAAKFHANTLERLENLCPSQYRARADFHARRGEWTEAERDFSKASPEVLGNDAEDWEAHAVVLLKLGTEPDTGNSARFRSPASPKAAIRRFSTASSGQRSVLRSTIRKPTGCWRWPDDCTR